MQIYAAAGPDRAVLLREAADLVAAAAELVAEANRRDPDPARALRDDIALTLAWTSVDLDVAAGIAAAPDAAVPTVLPSRAARGHRHRLVG
jgi:hypothetical protein